MAATAREPGPGEREAMLLLLGRLDAGGDVNVRCPPVRGWFARATRRCELQISRRALEGARGVGSLNARGCVAVRALHAPRRSGRVSSARACGPGGATWRARRSRRSLSRQSGKTQLGGAACASWLHLAKLLIERGAQVDATDAVRGLPAPRAAGGRAHSWARRDDARRRDARPPPARRT